MERGPLMSLCQLRPFSAVRVTDEDCRTVDPPQRASYGGDVVRGCVERRILGGYHLVTFCLKRGVTLLKHELSAQGP